MINGFLCSKEKRKKRFLKLRKLKSEAGFAHQQNEPFRKTGKGTKEKSIGEARSVTEKRQRNKLKIR